MWGSRFCSENIGDVLGLRILGEQVIERLILTRAFLGDRLKTVLSVSEDFLGVYEYDARGLVADEQAVNRATIRLLLGRHRIGVETKDDDHTYQGRQFWPSDFRDEVLARLLALNAETTNSMAPLSTP